MLKDISTTLETSARNAENPIAKKVGVSAAGREYV